MQSLLIIYNSYLAKTSVSCSKIQSVQSKLNVSNSTSSMASCGAKVVAEYKEQEKEANKFIDEAIKESRIVVIAESHCYDSDKLCEVLSHNAKDYIRKNIDVDFGADERRAIEDSLHKSYRSSVPLVFVNGEFKEKFKSYIKKHDWQRFIQDINKLKN